MPFAVELVYDRHEQCLTRPACLHEQAALEQRIAVAGAGLIIGVAPSLSHPEGPLSGYNSTIRTEFALIELQLHPLG